MDQELIGYLDERFRELDERFLKVDERFLKVDELFLKVDERFRETSEHIIQQVVHQVRTETQGQIQSLRKEMDERFKEVNETTRQTLVIVEDLRDEIHLVAEAFLGTDERVQRLEDAKELTFETVKGWMEPYFNSIDERGRELDARSVQLDVPVKDLTNRVRVLEGRATRGRKKVMKAVAENVAGGKRSRPPSPTT
jgi:predicted  nucleic acid-binding Zn-ribbon protein